jgi:hypothetical protein
MYLFVTYYGFGVDASSYIYCSEIFPTNIRAQGVGLSISGLFLMNTSKYFSDRADIIPHRLSNAYPSVYITAAGPAFNHIGWKFYLLFIIIPSLMLPFIVYYYPETKGLSLEEIGALFGDEVVLDISHLSEKERAELDERIERTVDITQFEGNTGDSSESSSAKQVETVLETMGKA